MITDIPFDALAPFASPYGPPPPVKGKRRKPPAGIRDKPRRFREHMAHWLSMTAGAFKWGFPEQLAAELPPHYTEQEVQRAGWLALIKVGDELHLAGPTVAAFNGKFTPYYQPGGCIVTNAYATDWDGEYIFGENAVLLRNTPDFLSVAQIIAPRVEMQTEADVTMVCALQNLRVINLVKAKDTDATEAADIFLGQVEWGFSGIVTAGAGKTWSGAPEEAPLEALPLSPVPGAYMQQMIECQQYVHASLYNDLGIQSNWNAKREALSADEVGAGEEALRPLIDIMLAERQAFCDEVKRVFDIDITVELSGAWAQRQKLDEMEEAQAEAAEALAEAQEEHAEELAVPEPDPVDGQSEEEQPEEVSENDDSPADDT